MSLKSGLLAESTWVLDVLAVLLRDDVTVSWFGLQHLPGLVNVLLEHLRRCLIQLFPEDFDDLEVILDTSAWSPKRQHCMDGEAHNSLDESDDKHWDIYGDVDRCLLDWQLGRGDLTTHIQTHFNHSASGQFATDRFFGRQQLSTVDTWSTSDDMSQETRPSAAEQHAGACGDGLVDTCPDVDTGGDMDMDGWLRGQLKRVWSDVIDDVDEDGSAGVLNVVSDDRQDISWRCLALSNIIRGLSFVPGNDSEMARHADLVATLSRLLVYGHQHCRPGLGGLKSTRVVCRRSDVAELLRHDTLVTFANIAGQLELESYPEELCVPVLDGLLHWASCRAPCAVDPLPQRRDRVSARRLALEALCKLCVTDSNVDLLLATPPFDRLLVILGDLMGAMTNPDCDQVWREFAIVLASSLVAGDPGVARALVLHHSTVSVLVGFVEAAAAEGGTSVDMVRRAASLLAAICELPEGRSELEHNYQSRILELAVSETLDCSVLSTIAHILHVCSVAA